MKRTELQEHNRFYVDVLKSSRPGETHMRHERGSFIQVVACNLFSANALPELTMINSCLLPLHPSTILIKVKENPLDNAVCQMGQVLSLPHCINTYVA